MGSERKCPLQQRRLYEDALDRLLTRRVTCMPLGGIRLCILGRLLWDLVSYGVVDIKFPRSTLELARLFYDYGHLELVGVWA